MSNFRLLCWVCAGLFFIETNGANLVSAQNPRLQTKKAATKIARKTALPKIAAVNKPTVTKIDFENLKAVLKQNADAKRPLLVNFWATWCPPCREEFPELVKIDADYRAKGLEFITVSLDDLAEIERDVPQFLSEMKAAMPAYLLKTADEEAAIHAIAPDWRGALPLTVLYNSNGKPVFTRMGAVKSNVLRAQIEKVLPRKQN